MKHIGWCLDRMQIALAYIPKEVRSDPSKGYAILDEIQEYANTLEQLVMHPDFQARLRNPELPNPMELYKDLEHALYVSDLYLKNLREIIAQRPDEWYRKADQLVLMIQQKFGDEKGELRPEFQVALYDKDELKQIVTSGKHLIEFLKHL